MRSLVIRYLEDRARNRLSRLPNVNIDPTSKLQWRRLAIDATNALSIGAGCTIECRFAFERPGARISVGSNTAIGGSLLAAATEIVIGDDVLISWGCNIVDHNSHSMIWDQRKNDTRDWYKGRNFKDWSNVATQRVVIGDKCWIGLNVIVLKGVEIGEGAVVGAGSVVTRSIPPWKLAVGNPARVIRDLPREEEIR